jgi:hypothetical protein
MGSEDLTSKRNRTWAARVCVLASLCASCDLFESSPTGDPSHPLQEAGARVDASTDASGVARDASLDASPEAALDAALDFSLDGAPDISGDAPPNDDRSDVEGGGDMSLDGAMSDITPFDQLAPSDGSDADGKPRSPTCTVDHPCLNGDCVGQSCDQAWECFSHFAPHPCPFETVPYCGCDGKTYYFPVTCSEVPYEHVGACGDGVNCDPGDVRCGQPEPDCGPGKVASVIGTCYGPCVDIGECRCVFSFECPKRDLYSCTAELHCGL